MHLQLESFYLLNLCAICYLKVGSAPDIFLSVRFISSLFAGLTVKRVPSHRIASPRDANAPKRAAVGRSVGLPLFPLVLQHFTILRWARAWYACNCAIRAASRETDKLPVQFHWLFSVLSRIARAAQTTRPTSTRAVNRRRERGCTTGLVNNRSAAQRFEYRANTHSRAVPVKIGRSQGNQSGKCKCATPILHTSDGHVYDQDTRIRTSTRSYLASILSSVHLRAVVRSVYTTRLVVYVTYSLVCTRAPISYIQRTRTSAAMPPRLLAADVR